MKMESCRATADFRFGGGIGASVWIGRKRRLFYAAASVIAGPSVIYFLLPFGFENYISNFGLMRLSYVKISSHCCCVIIFFSSTRS